MSTQRYSKQDAIDGLQSVADKIGKSPTITEYQKHKKNRHPSAEWIMDNLTSWNDVKTDAGLDVYKRRHKEQDYVGAIQYVAKKIGEVPTCTQYHANKKDSHPSMDSVYRHFGNWPKAMEAAGLR
jgi:cell fate (sporulation/competence/biofilm development) regulator YmcA (YheA/YmcA/DUF963 family)